MGDLCWVIKKIKLISIENSSYAGKVANSSKYSNISFRDSVLGAGASPYWDKIRKNLFARARPLIDTVYFRASPHSSSHYDGFQATPLSLWSFLQVSLCL
jgi:hypothetical protein